jgi:hypothetical protein
MSGLGSGSAPGERRGGRAKGTPNKAKAAERIGIAEALKVAFANIGPEAIDGMTPAQMLRLSMREAAKAGFIQAACALAKDAAPYFDRRADGGDEAVTGVTIRIIGGIPERTA